MNIQNNVIELKPNSHIKTSHLIATVLSRRFIDMTIVNRLQNSINWQKRAIEQIESSDKED